MMSSTSFKQVLKRYGKDPFLFLDRRATSDLISLLSNENNPKNWLGIVALYQSQILYNRRLGQYHEWLNSSGMGYQ